MTRQYQRDSGCAAMGVSVIFVSHDRCALLFSVRWTHARANGTAGQGTHATKNDARAETANMELTDPCHSRTYKCWTPVTRELGIFENEHDFSVARSGSEWLDSGFLENVMCFRKRNVFF